MWIPPAPDQPSPLRVAFLLANWYSGATLLSLILDSHPDIVSNGEIYHDLKKAIRCSCGALATECPFYREAAEHMWDSERWDPSLFRVTPDVRRRGVLGQILTTPRFTGRWRNSLSYRLLGSEHRRFLEAQETLMRNALRLGGGSVYLDGTKSHRRAEMMLSEARHSSSPLILLVRHPLSWCARWRKRRKKATLAMAVRTWRRYIRNSFALASAFPGTTLHMIRYEDLCLKPEETLTSLLEVLGLNYSERMLAVREPGGHHAMGNTMRFSFDGVVHAPTLREDELEPSEKRIVLQKCRRIMKQVGYL